MNTIREPARDTPVVHETDICVVGGSCTGVFAAVRAARLGARVAIVEKHNCFGGVATAGLVNVWHSLHDEVGEQKIISGLTEEVIDRLRKRDGVHESSDRSVSFGLNTEELKMELDELVTEHRIVPFLHTYYVGPHGEIGELKGIIIENKAGRGAILAKIFIDATGDADLCVDLDCPSYLPETLQPPTMCAKIYGLHTLADWNWQRALTEHGSEFGLEEDWGWGGFIPGLPGTQMRADMHVFDVDTSKGDDLTRSEIEGRRKIRAMMDIIRKYGPSHSRIGLADLAATIGARETGRINARYQLAGDDVLYGRGFDDAIAYGSYRVDIHHSEGPGITFRYLDGTEAVIPSRGAKADVGRWRETLERDPTFYQIPYRCLLQEKYPNLLMSGRMIDADKTAFSAVRVMVNMNQTGEAAGVAAYLSLSGARAVQDVVASDIQRELTKGGSVAFQSGERP
jgi:hypothetical protein